MRVLPRACLREAGGLFLFYAAIYLALILVGFATPLLKQGAPVEAVFFFLVDQIPFLTTLSFPLALITATLATIGRMREDGEITALMAAGVSTWAVARAFLPITVVVAAYLGLTAHLLLPHFAERAIVGRENLMRQAIAAQVGRRVPLWDRDGMVVSANGVAGDELSGVFGVQLAKDGQLFVCYAPHARLVAKPEGENWQSSRSDEIAALGLEMEDARFLVREAPKDGHAPQVTTGYAPRPVVGVPGPTKDFSNRPELLSTPELWRRIDDERANIQRLGDLGQRRDRERYLHSLERSFHVRFLLPLAVLAQWSFACGLGFALGRGNRLIAVVLGLVIVAVSLMPSMVLAKEVGDALSINAGWIVWLPSVFLSCAGVWLLWRHR